MREKILLVDDDTEMLFLHKRIIEKKFYCQTASTPKEALEIFARENFSIILLDLYMDGEEKAGFSVLKKIRAQDKQVQVILFSSSDRFVHAQEALRLGANDYLVKGATPEELYFSLEQALERKKWSRLERSLRLNQERIKENEPLLGNSPAIQALKKQVDKIAPSNIPVLLEGETGTGKELVAKSLHYKSKDTLAPFIAVNCAAIPKDMAEALFFGHERGAFTGALSESMGYFEQAHNGTLFLDEINSLSLELQAKILRALQEQEIQKIGGKKKISVSIRVLSASNQNLGELTREAKFREDLFFRISGITIRIPPLRQRAEDLPLLMEAFAQGRKFSAQVKKYFESYSWPGNIRELKNVIQAMLVFAEAEEILGLEHLPENILERILAGTSLPANRQSFSQLLHWREQNEKDFYRKAYELAGGSLVKLAKGLQMNRSHLHRKLVEMKLHRPRKFKV